MVEWFDSYILCRPSKLQYILEKNLLIDSFILPYLGIFADWFSVWPDGDYVNKIFSHDLSTTLAWWLWVVRPLHCQNWNYEQIQTLFFVYKNTFKEYVWQTRTSKSFSIEYFAFTAATADSRSTFKPRYCNINPIKFYIYESIWILLRKIVHFLLHRKQVYVYVRCHLLIEDKNNGTKQWWVTE